MRDETLKTVLLLALASAKRVDDLHGLSHEVRHSKSWNCLFSSFVPDLVAETQVLSSTRGSSPYYPFGIFKDGVPNGMLLDRVLAAREYLRRFKRL